MGRVGVFLALLVGVGACAAFEGSQNDAADVGDAGADGAGSGGPTVGVPDADAPDSGAAGSADGGGLDCTGALVCDDFERSEVKDATHLYLATQTSGTIGIANGVLDAMVDASTETGTGPTAIVELYPTGTIAVGAVVASVDLDLELVERGAASAGYTNIMSVDFDTDANFTIYLDGQANVQMLMKTEVETKSFVVTAANAGKRHVHLEGTFQKDADFSVTLDGVLVKQDKLQARVLTTPAPHVELGVRDVDVRGKNHVTIDNFVVRVRSN